MLHPLLQIINYAIEIYSFFVFVYILIRLLCYLNVLNQYKPIVSKLLGLFGDIVEPALNYIRRYVKPFNGMDFSPIILIFGLNIIQYTLFYYFG